MIEKYYLNLKLDITWLKFVNPTFLFLFKRILNKKISHPKKKFEPSLARTIIEAHKFFIKVLILTVSSLLTKFQITR